MMNKLANGLAASFLLATMAVAAPGTTKQPARTVASSTRTPRPRATAELHVEKAIQRAFPEQNGRTDAGWSTALTDIARHLPNEPRYTDAYGRYIRAGDLVTAGHEWTHFVNEYLTLRAGAGSSAYYLMNNQFVTLTDPEGLRGQVPTVPESLKADLFQLYFVQNGSNAAVDPLYLLDEWVAYGNDVSVAVAQLQSRKPLNSADSRVIQTRTAGNLLEFTFYGFAVGEAVKKHDPAYYAGPHGRQFRNFLALNARRSLDVYEQALARRELSQDDTRHTALLRSFRSSPDAAAMRAWVRSDLGADLADRLLTTLATPDRRLTSATPVRAD